MLVSMSRCIALSAAPLRHRSQGAGTLGQVFAQGSARGLEQPLRKRFLASSAGAKSRCERRKIREKAQE
jgi:hypothetical protein